jgi:hypothetical protein
MENASLREDLSGQAMLLRRYGNQRTATVPLTGAARIFARCARQGGVRCSASEILQTPLTPLAILRQPNERTATTITLLRVFEDPRQRSPVIFDAEVVRMNGL